MLSDHQFHRAVRGITLSYEVLVDRFITSFLNWIDRPEQSHLLKEPNSEPNGFWDLVAETLRAMEESSDPL